MQDALEDYYALKALRRAKRSAKDQLGRPLEEVAEELALI
jgi:hypothetical protein